MLRKGGEEATELLDEAGRRWRMYEEAHVMDTWKAMAEFAQVSQVFLRLALSHSRGALLQWAFKEYAFAVRVVVEERAAGLFYEQGRKQFCFTSWSLAAKQMAVANSQAARAIFFFCGRLINLIFFRWYAIAHRTEDHAACMPSDGLWFARGRTGASSAARKRRAGWRRSWPRCTLRARSRSASSSCGASTCATCSGSGGSRWRGWRATSWGCSARFGWYAIACTDPESP